MITTLEVAGVTYTPIVSDKVTGSLFRDTSLGANLPREVTIRHQEYVDSKTKRPGRRSVLRLDRNVQMSDGTIAPVSCMIVAMVPKDVNVTNAIIADVIAITANAHGSHTDHTDIGLAVFRDAEQ